MHFCEYPYLFKVVCLIEVSSKFIQEKARTFLCFAHVVPQVCVSKSSANAFFKPLR